MELSLIKQRLQLLQEEVFSITPDLERRNQKLEDMLQQQQMGHHRVSEVLAAGPLPAVDKGLNVPSVIEAEVQDVRRRLEEFLSCWPGSLQAEHIHLDEVRHGIEARVLLA